MKKKVAFFDIDKTIIKNDSMFLFLWYGIKKKPQTIVTLLPVFVYTVLYSMKLVKPEKPKEFYFYAIKYFRDEDLKDFYQSILVKKLYEDAVKELKEKKENGFHVLLVSASPDAYVRFFRELPFVDGVIGTKLLRKGEGYTNKLEGANCKGVEKVHRINQYIDTHQIEIDFEHSCAYSDSLTDLPMFSLVKNQYLINRKDRIRKELIWKK